MAEEWQRVGRGADALWSKPRRAARSRWCDGHMAPKRHRIEAGDTIVWSALPPGGELGYERWQHAAFCADCAPAEPKAAA